MLWLSIIPHGRDDTTPQSDCLKLLLLTSVVSLTRNVNSNRESGIRSLDESSHLNQSEAVKVARAVKQKNQNWGLHPYIPIILVDICLVLSKINLETDNPPPNTLNFW